MPTLTDQIRAYQAGDTSAFDKPRATVIPTPESLIGSTPVSMPRALPRVPAADIMPTTPYIPEMKKSVPPDTWWARNRKWAVPVGGGLLAVGLIATLTRPRRRRRS